MYKLILNKNAFSDVEKQRLEGVFDSHLKVFLNRSEMLLDEIPDQELIIENCNQLDVDINLLPEGFESGQVKLVVSDMDSTLINIECVDEIADFANVKKEVSRVTEAAMRGELDFAGSLIERVKLLTGLDESALQRVYDERLKLNPGAEVMLQGLKKHNIKFALVSGGFTFFTSRLKKRLSLDYTLANTLEIENGKLTGFVQGDIIGAEAKASFLLEKCKELDISPDQVVAIGDGANDLKMMAVAGLGIAYHAKPKVQKEANCALNHSGLEGLLSLLSID